MNEFFTWQTLVTFAGAAGGTAVITQFLKDYLSKVPTQILSYIIAFVILTVATAATAGFITDWEVWAIIPFNAVIVSLSANGGFSAVERAKEDTKE